MAVRDVSLQVRAGEFLSLLGPSGSGKTTLLMMIAGFEFPDGGRIDVGGRDITRLEPNLRDIGMVFQRYALFPHMTVSENVGFPLRMRRLPRAEIKRQVSEALAMVRLSGFENRRPDQLSGGQQQRVALARATVFHPPLILMDEPLGALDKKLRDQMQIEIKSLQRKLGATVIYVTHDQQEALAMSDRVAVMNHGVIEQLSTPRDLYNEPESIFVADFVGDTNLVPGKVVALENEIATLDAGSGLTVRGRVSHASAATLSVGQAATLSVRPEHVRLLDRGAVPDGALSMKREQEIYTGENVAIVGALANGAGFRVHQAVAAGTVTHGEEWLDVVWAPGDARVFAGGGTP